MKTRNKLRRDRKEARNANEKGMKKLRSFVTMCSQMRPKEWAGLLHKGGQLLFTWESFQPGYFLCTLHLPRCSPSIQVGTIEVQLCKEKCQSHASHNHRKYFITKLWHDKQRYLPKWKSVSSKRLFCSKNGFLGLPYRGSYEGENGCKYSNIWFLQTVQLLANKSPDCGLTEPLKPLSDQNEWIRSYRHRSVSILAHNLLDVPGEIEMQGWEVYVPSKSFNQLKTEP